MCSPSKRRDVDVMKLMMSDYKVETINDSVNDFCVEFKGPTTSLYSEGTWKVRVKLPDDYPFKKPSLRFVNRIYHPNIDEISGSICLDVIRNSWSPMFVYDRLSASADLVNIFEVFLPQLLLYPNPSHPLNREAASMMMRDHNVYEQTVKEHCMRYAKTDNSENREEEEDDDDDASESDD
ncbi:hypothetical protein GIB67_005445 [Kingdonia uniflora]|uniref:Ubiquitin-conjugating enzyme E2 H n=1 Tax=Kingdonia uniflora TaxID=39325 RepID=A0A7J7NHN5_9MAGN|nr:hypothetical protein GIB67_005445 [Kingdonia uniflora]